jgi:integrase
LILDRNPCSGLTRPAKPPTRDRVLTDDEIRSFWRASEQIGEPHEQALKLLLLTGQRLDEIAAMTWDELSVDRLTLNLAAVRTKNNRPHFIPLGPMSRELIANVHRIAHCPFVFTTNGRRPLVNFSHVKTRLDVLMRSLQPWRLHDLRRTVASRLAEAGTSPIVIEKILNHASGLSSGVAGVYNRFDYAAERRAALEAWERKLKEITT